MTQWTRFELVSDAFGCRSACWRTSLPYMLESRWSVGLAAGMRTDPLSDLRMGAETYFNGQGATAVGAYAGRVS